MDNFSEELESSPIDHRPELTISQDGHKIFAVMGYTNEDKKRTIAIERLPRQFLHWDEEQQKWFLQSEGIAKRLLKKLRLLPETRTRSIYVKNLPPFPAGVDAAK